MGCQWVGNLVERQSYRHTLNKSFARYAFEFNNLDAIFDCNHSIRFAQDFEKELCA